MPPLIITLTLDQSSHLYFTKLRTQYFPAYCNYLEAHLTLFHRLPDIGFIPEQLPLLSNRNIIPMQVTGITNTGNGVSYTIESDELQRLHKQMQSVFKPYLISKDRNKLRPHITIQNKVTAYKAQQTSQKLQQEFKPFPISATGFSLWKYLKGTWEYVGGYPFIDIT